MLKSIRYILCLLLFSANIMANTLILYPSQTAWLNYEFPIEKSNSDWRINNLPKGIIANSIQIIRPSVLEWRYRYSLENESTLWSHLYKKNLNLIESHKTTNATLLYKDPALSIFQSKNEVIINPKAEITLNTEDIAAVPKILFSEKPDSEKAQLICQNTEIDSAIYYAANLDDEKKQLILRPQIHIQNKTGMDFDQLKIVVINGAPNLIETNQKTYHAKLMAQAANDAASLTELNSDEYFIYQLPQLHQIGNASYHVFQLMSPITFPIEKCYQCKIQVNSPWLNQQAKWFNCDMVMKFKNTANKPLPAGEIRIFENDTFIGQSLMPSTPRSGTAEIAYGKAENIRIRKIKTESISSPGQIEENYVIQVENFNNKYIEVTVLDELPYEDAIISKISVPYKLENANTIRLTLKIPPKNTFEVTYKLTQKRR